MNSFRASCAIVVLVGASSLRAHGDTNTWGQILYTHYQSSKVYYAPSVAAAVRQRLGANETLKADFRIGNWCAVFKPSEQVGDIANIVGFMEVSDLFPYPLPAGPITGGVGSSPPVAASIESKERLSPPSKSFSLPEPQEKTSAIVSIRRSPRISR